MFFSNILGHDKRLYTKTLNDEDMEKQEEYVLCDRDDYLGKHKFQFIKNSKVFVDTILEDLTPYDVRQLIMMEDEVAQTKVFLFNIYLK